MAFNETDVELRTLLSRATDEELEPLLDCILDKDRSGRISSSLDTDPEYRAHPHEPSRYWKKIGEEIQRYGGNTFANLFRGGAGVCYHEILVDVAKQLKLNFNENSESERIELLLMNKIFEDAWDDMSPEERARVIQETGMKNVSKATSDPAMTMALQAALRAGGFATYQFTLIVVNMVWRILFGHGLKIATNAALTRAMGVFLGPIGWTVTGIWLALDLAGPAFRVTVPAVLQIALIRQSQMMRNA